MLPVYTYSYLLRSLAIESFKFNCPYKFFAELQLSFVVSFWSYVVLAHHDLPCIILEGPEPILG